MPQRVSHLCESCHHNILHVTIFWPPHNFILQLPYNWIIWQFWQPHNFILQLPYNWIIWQPHIIELYGNHQIKWYGGRLVNFICRPPHIWVIWQPPYNSILSPPNKDMSGHHIMSLYMWYACITSPNRNQVRVALGLSFPEDCWVPKPNTDLG